MVTFLLSLESCCFEFTWNIHYHELGTERAISLIQVCGCVCVRACVRVCVGGACGCACGCVCVFVIQSMVSCVFNVPHVHPCSFMFIHVPCFHFLNLFEENMKTELAALLGTPEDMITITAVRPR